MTTIEYTSDDNKVSIIIDGHADYNPGGEDIVCSALSILTCTLMNALLDLEDRCIIFNYGHTDTDDAGHAEIRYQYLDCDLKEVSSVVDTILLGYELLSNTYPDNVQLKI